MFITKHGVKWELQGEHEVYYSPTGDPMVVGPVTVLSQTPAPTTGRNGFIISAERELPNGQSWDNRMQNIDYVAPGNFPVTLQAGDSLMSAVSIANFEGQDNPSLEEVQILTVLSEPPAEQVFRPSYLSGCSKVWSAACLSRVSELPKNPVPAGITLNTNSRFFNHPWLKLKSNWTDRYVHPNTNQERYGREIAKFCADAGIMMACDIPEADKVKILAWMIQYGLDCHAAVKLGARFWADGGHNNGPLLPMIVAAHFLDNAELKAQCSKDFDGFGAVSEHMQLDYVSQEAVDVSHSADWVPNGQGSIPTEYDTRHIGLPEWTITKGWEKSNHHFKARYRQTAGSGIVSCLVACKLLKLESLWNNPAAFEYLHRYMAHEYPTSKTAEQGIADAVKRKIEPFPGYDGPIGAGSNATTTLANHFYQNKFLPEYMASLEPAEPPIDPPIDPPVEPEPMTTPFFEVPPRQETYDFKRRLIVAHMMRSFPPIWETNSGGINPATGLPFDQYDVFLEKTPALSGYESKGGFITQRPIIKRINTLTTAERFQEDVNEEVARICEAGFDGIVIDILHQTTHQDFGGYKRWFRAAAARTDFKVTIMPDMTGLTTATNGHLNVPEIIRQLVAEGGYQTMMFKGEERVLIMPYFPEAQPASYWVSLFEGLKAEGINCVMAAVCQGSTAYIETWEQADIDNWLIAGGEWGSRYYGYGKLVSNTQEALFDRYGIDFVQPGAQLHYARRSNKVTAPENTTPGQDGGGFDLALRLMDTAFEEGPRFFQQVTYNDYSEGSEIRPSSKIGWVWHDLYKYFNHSYKLGYWLPITKDVIFYAHRQQLINAPLHSSSKQTSFLTMNGLDTIQMLAFLTAPAKMRIKIAGNVYEKEVPAGRQVFSVPVSFGRPEFEIVRDNVIVKRLKSRTRIKDYEDENEDEILLRQDLMHHLGSTQEIEDGRDLSLAWHGVEPDTYSTEPNEIDVLPPEPELPAPTISNFELVRTLDEGETVVGGLTFDNAETIQVSDENYELIGDSLVYVGEAKTASELDEVVVTAVNGDKTKSVTVDVFHYVAPPPVVPPAPLPNLSDFYATVTLNPGENVVLSDLTFADSETTITLTNTDYVFDSGMIHYTGGIKDEDQSDEVIFTATNSDGVEQVYSVHVRHVAPPVVEIEPPVLEDLALIVTLEQGETFVGNLEFSGAESIQLLGDDYAITEDGISFVGEPPLSSRVDEVTVIADNQGESVAYSISVYHLVPPPPPPKHVITIEKVTDGKTVISSEDDLTGVNINVN